MPEAFDGLVIFRNGNGETIVAIDPDAVSTPIRLLDANGSSLLEITFSAELSVGGGGEGGDVILRLGNGEETIHLRAERATIEAGGNSEAGLFILRNADGEIVVRAQAADGSLVAGGHGASGVLALHRANASQIGNFSEAVIHGDAEIGALILRDAVGRQTVRLDGRPEEGRLTSRNHAQRRRPK